MGAEFPSEPHKLIVVTIFLALAGISNWAALAYIHDIVPRLVSSDSSGIKIGTILCVHTRGSHTSDTLFLCVNNKNMIFEYVLKRYLICKRHKHVNL